MRSDTPARPRRPAPSERDVKLDAMANAPARGKSLNEHLQAQWAFIECDKRLKEAGRLIIDHIDDDGYLRVSLEELSSRTNNKLSVELLSEALRRIQSLDPPGIGACDLKECLILQLNAESAVGTDVELEMQIVKNFLRDVEMNRLPHIAKRTGRTLDEIKAALKNLSHLNPRPGLLVSERTIPVIRPDAIVDLGEDGTVFVTMTDGNSPRLAISKSYRRMARNRDVDKNTRHFIQNNVRSAKWLISAIAQRQQTVRRVVEEVFRVQKVFLVEGKEALKPLPMAEIADKVGVHVATVSRAVAGKYVQTPRGIYPLRMFFSGGTRTAKGEDVAWDAVRVKLQEVIDAEDKSKPMNDDQLAAELKSRGIKIARRTVAKYRKMLNIPPARKRRQY